MYQSYVGFWELSSFCSSQLPINFPHFAGKQCFYNSVLWMSNTKYPIQRQSKNSETSCIYHQFLQPAAIWEIIARKSCLCLWSSYYNNPHIITKLLWCSLNICGNPTWKGKENYHLIIHGKSSRWSALLFAKTGFFQKSVFQIV